MKRKCCCCFGCLCSDDDNLQNNDHEEPRSNRIRSCKLHKVMIGILVTFGLMFSIFSSFDCKYVRVDVGFKPDNTIYRSGEFGLGLWTMEDPTTPGKCLTIDISRTLGSITQGDHYYSSSFLNGDVIWGAARITALSGLFFGLVDALTLQLCISAPPL